MAGFENDVVYAKNADFTQADNQSPTESNGLATNGQLWIGTTSTNAGGTHINVGAITSPDASVVVGYSSPNITLTAAGLSPTTFTGDTGTANPVLNNINILGQKAGTVPVMFTTASGSTVDIEDRTWTTQFVVDPSAVVGLRGTFTTITSALAAAVSGQTIYIRPGTYTENLTLKAGVNLCSYDCNGQNSQVLIVGGASASFTGSCSLSGLALQDDGLATNPQILVTGANATVVNLINCKIIAASGTSLVNQSSNAASQLNVFSCDGNISGGSGTTLFRNTGIGSSNFYFSSFTNTGASVTANAISAGSGLFISCAFNNGISTSVSGQTIISGTSIQNSAINTAGLVIVSNAGATVTASNCYLDSGTASAVSLDGSNATINLTNSTLKTSNASAISRVGSTPTFKYSNLSFIGTSSVMDAALAQVPFVSSNDAVQIKSPGAYPYTTVPQDGVILVDSSSARTIVPLASPTTGQMHRIKDSVGSAAANNITVTPSGKNIDGAASFVINSNYGSIDIVYSGTQWLIL